MSCDLGTDGGLIFAAFPSSVGWNAKKYSTSSGGKSLNKPSVVKGVIALAAASALGAVVAWIASNRESKSDGVGVGDGATSEIDASLFFET